MQGRLPLHEDLSLLELILQQLYLHRYNAEVRAVLNTLNHDKINFEKLQLQLNQLYQSEPNSQIQNQLFFGSVFCLSLILAKYTPRNYIEEGSILCPVTGCAIDPADRILTSGGVQYTRLEPTFKFLLERRDPMTNLPLDQREKNYLLNRKNYPNSPEIPDPRLLINLPIASTKRNYTATFFKGVALGFYAGIVIDLCILLMLIALSIAAPPLTPLVGTILYYTLTFGLPCFSIAGGVLATIGLGIIDLGSRIKNFFVSLCRSQPDLSPPEQVSEEIKTQANQLFSKMTATEVVTNEVKLNSTHREVLTQLNQNQSEVGVTPQAEPAKKPQQRPNAAFLDLVEAKAKEMKKRIPRKEPEEDELPLAARYKAF